MENIFIDTSIYEEGQFIGSGTLKTLFDAAKERHVRIILPIITEHEVLGHIQEKINAECAKLKRQLASPLKHIEPLYSKLEDVVKHTETAVEDMKKMFLKQLEVSNIYRLPLQENIDLHSIVESYFRKEPPFSNKKKSEFPDALVLKSLEQWCKENNQTCIVLSNDNDMKSYKSAYLIPREIDEYTMTLTHFIQEGKHQENELNQVSINAYNSLVADTVIKQQISDWVCEQLDNDVLYYAALQIEDINDYSIRNPNIDYIDHSELIGSYDMCLVYKLMVKIVTDIIVNHPDYDTAYYDGEDKQWYFFDDAKETTLTSRLEIAIEFITDQNGDFPELNAINSGKNLSQNKLVNSFNYGRRWK